MNVIYIIYIYDIYIYMNVIYIYDIRYIYIGFPGSSAGKESACNGGDPDLFLGSGRSPREGICYPLKYCASLVVQTVKNLPAMWET